MKKFIAAIDDTGTNESLFKMDGTPIPGDQPTAGFGILGINEAYYLEASDRWNKLRLRIQEETQTSYLPEIHLRHMFGTTLPKNMRDRPNPYLLVSREARISYISEAYKIISDVSKNDQAIIRYTWIAKRSDLIEDVRGLALNPLLRSDLKKIPKNMREVRRRYWNKLMDPIIRGVVHCLRFVDETARVMGVERVEMFLDSFSSVENIDNPDTYQIISEAAGFSQTLEAKVVSARDEFLVQAIDLVLYFQQRLFKAQNGLIKRDKLTERFIQFNPIKDACEVSVKQRVTNLNLRTQGHPDAYVGPHYALARQAAYEASPDFVEENFETVAEMMVAIRESREGERLDENDSYVSFWKD